MNFCVRVKLYLIIIDPGLHIGCFVVLPQHRCHKLTSCVLCVFQQEDNSYYLLMVKEFGESCNYHHRETKTAVRCGLNVTSVSSGNRDEQRFGFLLPTTTWQPEPTSRPARERAKSPVPRIPISGGCSSDIGASRCQESPTPPLPRTKGLDMSSDMTH